jgi:autotransporter-associated beta strand protein
MKHAKTSHRISLAGTIFTAIQFVALLAWSDVFAGSATWALTASNNWSDPSNWVPKTVPDGPDDVATFDLSNGTAISASNIEVNSIVFNPGASAYTITCSSLNNALDISGAGVVNNSGTTQNFVANDGASIALHNSASAGNDIVFTANPGSIVGGSIVLSSTTNGGSATFIAKQDPSGRFAEGKITFLDESSAGNATVIAEAGPIEGYGLVTFEDAASAGNATLVANFIASGNGGHLDFERFASGGTARVILYGNGTIQPGNGSLGLVGRRLSAGDFTIGSLEGDGQVVIGTYPPTGTLNLNIGSNNLSTTFGGVITGVFSAGAITKIGTGTLTLTNGANTYTGGTNVNQGALLVSNTTGLGAGGPIKVNAGTLGGTGTVAGPVTVGTGSGTGAFFAPAYHSRKPATFTIQGALTFNADSTYSCSLKAKGGRARNDQVVAGGVTIQSGAIFFLHATIRGSIASGTVFTAISNTAATPIAGTFSNLLDGGLVTVGGTTFQADYEGGDGNDLTLTVL